MSNLNFYISRAQGHNQAISVNHFINENFSKYLSKIVEVLNEDITYKINQDNSIQRAQDAWDAQVTGLKVADHTIKTFFNLLKKYHNIKEDEIVLLNNNQTKFNLENFINFLKNQTNKTLDENSNISEVSNGSTSFEFKITTDPKRTDRVKKYLNKLLDRIYTNINKKNNNNSLPKEDLNKFEIDLNKFKEKLNELLVSSKFDFNFDAADPHGKKNSLSTTELAESLIIANDTVFAEIVELINNLEFDDELLNRDVLDLESTIFNNKSKVNIQYFPNPLTGVTGTIAGS